MQIGDLRSIKCHTIWFRQHNRCRKTSDFLGSHFILHTSIFYNLQVFQLTKKAMDTVRNYSSDDESSTDNDNDQRHKHIGRPDEEGATKRIKLMRSTSSSSSFSSGTLSTLTPSPPPATSRSTAALTDKTTTKVWIKPFDGKRGNVQKIKSINIVNLAFSRPYHSLIRL